MEIKISIFFQALLLIFLSGFGEASYVDKIRDNFVAARGVKGEMPKINEIEKDIWIAPFIDIAEYVKEYKR